MRQTAADKALETTTERAGTYGHPSEVYKRTARLWSAYLDKEIRPGDVALMMLLFKLGREMNRHNEDNLIDSHGYLLVYERILRREKGLE